ncbi:hypothetical protein SLEP1_g49241 [Rubroshorea leprosula]|uniref:Uncharacterized protein n=1 Tax=Rubroshorea leprosula TaxID=152421 RepID=A0AAV5LX09_9ROSI|nr:hypothetical protein SLEP1_g49241 [Rubroshorea leprosula]
MATAPNSSLSPISVAITVSVTITVAGGRCLFFIRQRVTCLPFHSLAAGSPIPLLACHLQVGI